MPGYFPAQGAAPDVENYVFEQLLNAAAAVHDEVRARAQRLVASGDFPAV